MFFIFQIWLHTRTPSSIFFQVTLKEKKTKFSEQRKALGGGRGSSVPVPGDKFHDEHRIDVIDLFFFFFNHLPTRVIISFFFGFFFLLALLKVSPPRRRNFKKKISKKNGMVFFSFLFSFFLGSRRFGSIFFCETGGRIFQRLNDSEPPPKIRLLPSLLPSCTEFSY